MHEPISFHSEKVLMLELAESVFRSTLSSSAMSIFFIISFHLFAIQFHPQIILWYAHVNLCGSLIFWEISKIETMKWRRKRSRCAQCCRITENISYRTCQSSGWIAWEKTWEGQQCAMEETSWTGVWGCLLCSVRWAFAYFEHMLKTKWKRYEKFTRFIFWSCFSVFFALFTTQASIL